MCVIDTRCKLHRSVVVACTSQLGNLLVYRIEIFVVSIILTVLLWYYCKFLCEIVTSKTRFLIAGETVTHFIGGKIFHRISFVCICAITCDHDLLSPRPLTRSLTVPTTTLIHVIKVDIVSHMVEINLSITFVVFASSIAAIPFEIFGALASDLIFKETPIFGVTRGGWIHLTALWLI